MNQDIDMIKSTQPFPTMFCGVKQGLTVSVYFDILHLCNNQDG